MARSDGSAHFEGWRLSRSRRNAIYTHMSHGPILPMEEPGFLERLFGRR